MILLLSDDSFSASGLTTSLSFNPFLDRRSYLLNELDRGFDRVISEALHVQQVLKDGLSGIGAEQVAQIQLSNEFNIAEELVLTL